MERDEEFCTAIVEDIPRLRRLEQRIDRHTDQPGPRAGQRQYRGCQCLSHPAGDPVSRRRAAPKQTRSDPPDKFIERCIAERPFPPDQGRVDRKSGVEGKSVSVRVDPGGRRIIKTKKKKKKKT